MNTNCYCGNNKKFSECCSVFLNKTEIPEKAEELMRSRYSAFVLKNYDYLLATHDPKTNSDFDLEANKKWADSVQFTKLEVLKVKEYGVKTTVEFRAHYLVSSLRQVHHELSTFKNIAGQWYYSSGKHFEV